MDAFTLDEGIECRVSYKDLESDRRDIQVYSYPPTDKGELKLEMAFADTALPRATVQMMLERLGETVRRLSGDVDAPVVVLPSPIGGNIPLPIPVSINATNTDATTGTSTYTEAIQYTSSSAPTPIDPIELVAKTWHKFESLFPFPTPTDPTSTSTSPTPPLDAHQTPFYALGGDLVYAAQLSAWYAQAGIVFPIEAVIEYPSKAAQVEILAKLAASSGSKAEGVAKIE
ncbi:MAG: hypothetical protein LQ346_009129 [Caloplaca aetnensis]|nr:MAG: hypothetical protein LQ346_009129 [Caloplaca aetnensis]